MRIAMGIEYDGSGFCGWQRQQTGRTVQGCLEHAVASVADGVVVGSAHLAGTRVEQALAYLVDIFRYLFVAAIHLTQQDCRRVRRITGVDEILGRHPGALTGNGTAIHLARSRMGYLVARNAASGHQKVLHFLWKYDAVRHLEIPTRGGNDDHSVAV